MESRILLDSRKGEFLYGSDKAAVRFSFDPPLDFSSSVEYFVSLDHYELRQAELRCCIEVTFQFAEQVGEELPIPTFLDWGPVIQFRLYGNTLLKVFENLRAFIERELVPQHWRGGWIRQKKGKSGGPGTTVLKTGENSVRLSKNLASVLGFRRTEFPYEDIFEADETYDSDIPPNFDRFVERPVIMHLDSLQEHHIGGGGEAMMREPSFWPDSGRSDAYLAVMHWGEGDWRGFDDVLVRSRVPAGERRWVLLKQQAAITQMVFSFRWVDTFDVLDCQPVTFRFFAELAVKQRLMLTFA